MANFGVVFISLLLVCLLVCTISLANYLLISFGLYKIASERKIANPWMVWFPFASDWIIGSLAGDYDEKRGQKRNWNTTLLSLSLGAVVARVVYEFVVMILFCVFVIVIALVAESTASSENVIALISLILGWCIYIPLMLVTLIDAGAKLCRTLCFFKIFESIAPKKALMYTILYYMIPLAGGICLLRCHNKEYPDLVSETVEEE